MLNQLFESLLLELGDAEKIFRLLERRVFAGFDDVICEEITDSGEAHELVASGGVWVDFFAWLEFLITDGKIDLIVILALCFALDGEFFPIRLGPDAKPAFGGLEFEVIERVFILLRASITGAVGIDAERACEAGFDKFGGEVGADVARLSAIAAVLDRSPEPYFASLDGNEQYDDVDGVLALWAAMRAAPRLARLAASVIFIEQPIRRHNALARDVGALAREKPVIIDESDDTLDAFVRAKALGYAGVSSKTCKNPWRSVVNRARCERWNREAGAPRHFMSGEDLTIQAGLALQQDLALVTLLGIEHVERNGHHYVNGMASVPPAEQQAFLDAHPDLYERSHGAVRVAIRDGSLSIASLGGVGFASGAMPDWSAMRTIPDGTRR